MKLKRQHSAILFFIAFLMGRDTVNNWISETHKDYKIYYTAIDKQNKKEYLKIIDAGLKSVSAFFASPKKNKFDIFIHPDRHSLDSTWQNDWKCPTSNQNAGWLPVALLQSLTSFLPKHGIRHPENINFQRV